MISVNAARSSRPSFLTSRRPPREDRIGVAERFGPTTECARHEETMRPPRFLSQYFATDRHKDSQRERDTKSLGRPDETRPEDPGGISSDPTEPILRTAVHAAAAATPNELVFRQRLGAAPQKGRPGTKHQNVGRSVKGP